MGYRGPCTRGGLSRPRNLCQPSLDYLHNAGNQQELFITVSVKPPINLMALLFSLDTLMLTTVASQLSGGSVNSAIDVLTPYTITPLSLFQWNMVFFAALVVSYFSRAIRADLEKIRLKDRKGGERSQQTTLEDDTGN